MAYLSNSDKADKDKYKIYVFKESDLDLSKPDKVWNHKQIKVKYEDDSSNNSEAISIQDGELYVVTKEG